MTPLNHRAHVVFGTTGTHWGTATSEQRAPSRGTTASSGATLGLPRTISSPMAGPARRSADTACQAAAAAATATDRDVLCYGWPNPRRLIRNAIPTLSAYELYRPHPTTRAVQIWPFCAARPSAKPRSTKNT